MKGPITYLVAMLLVIGSSGLLANQRKIDSLLTLLKNEKTDTNKVVLLRKLYSLHANSDPVKAQEFAEKALSLSRICGYPTGEVSALISLGEVARMKGDYKQALKNYHISLKILEDLGEEGGYGELLEDAYLLYSESLFATNNYESAFAFHQKYTGLKDSLFNAENLRQVNEIQAKYETTRKDKELLQQKADIEKAESINRRQDLERNAVLFGFVLVAILVFFIIRGYRLQRRNNHEIFEQKEILEEKQKEILDSIRYARRIQNGMMPNERNLEAHLKRMRS